MYLPIQPPQVPVSPIISIIKPAEQLKAPPKEPSLEEKIASNYYKCATLTQWIWAQDATCHDKAPYYTVNTVTSSQNGSGGYVAGQCTALAWSKRPDLPSNLGNADTWGVNAQAQGFPVDNSPRAGDIGVAKGYQHVVYVDSVNSDGTINLTEQNYKGPFIISSRIAPISEFTYIHKK